MYFVHAHYIATTVPFYYDKERLLQVVEKDGDFDTVEN
jgi:hypothetical protein